MFNGCYNTGIAIERKVEFVQWRGDNKWEIERFIGKENKDHLKEENGRLVFFPVGMEEPKSDSCDPFFAIDVETGRPMSEILHERWVESCTLNDRDYIVRKNRRMLFVMRREDFEDQYEILDYEPEA